MRIIFMGTPDFALTALHAITKTEHEIVAVYSQPPRQAGRGHKVVPTPVARWAAEQGLPVETPTSLKSTDAQETFASYNADIAVVAAYGLLLPQAILDAPTHGCLNIHASLLPRWRGAAPIQRAIQAGDRKTGITIMQMDAGLDTGPMLLRGEVAIEDNTTGGSLHDALAVMGGALIVEALNTLPSLTPQSQPDTGATYAKKLTKQEAQLDWSQPAEVLERTIRAFTPWPGAFTTVAVDGDLLRLKIGAAIVGEGTNAAPGTVLEDATNDALRVACGDGSLYLTQLQKPGGRMISAKNFLNGQEISAGTVLG